MRKLGPTRVSYKDDYLISYRVYMMMGHFISRLFEGAIQNRKHSACATRASPSADRFHTKKGGRFAFTGYRCEILVQQPGWTHALVTRAGVKFVAYQVNKRRARRGDRSELAPARKSPRCHINSSFLLHANQRSNISAKSLSSLHTCVYIKWFPVFVIPVIPQF